MTDDINDSERENIIAEIHRNGPYAQKGWKDCPFCGGTMEFALEPYKSGVFGGTEYRLMFRHRDAEDCFIDDTEVDTPIQSFREQWNSRHVPPKQPGLLERSI